MSLLTANLRHLYQRRGLWLAYLMFTFFIAVSIMVPFDEPAAGKGRFIGLVVFAFIVGLLAAVLQMEIMTKPFAFCLPGHRQTVRNFILIIGAVTNVLSSMLFLFYPGLALAKLPVVLCSAFSAGLIFYLGGVWLAFHSKQPMSFLGFFVFAIFGGGILNLHIILERAIVEYPLPVILLGVLCGAATWIRLSDPSLARSNCLLPWIGFADAFNRQKIHRFNQTKAGADRWKRLKDHPRPWVEDFFISRMSRCDVFGKARFAWGALYTSFGVFISQWRGILLFATFIAIFLGYMGPRSWFALVFIPIMLFSTSRPITHSSMLTAGGRSERFCSTLVTVVAAAGLLTAFTGIIVLMSVLLATAIPDFTYYGIRFAYRAISVKALYAPLVFLPIAYAVHLIFYIRPILVVVISMLMMYLVMIVGMMPGGELAAITGPLPAASLAAFTWIVFVLVLHHIATRRCLVR